MNTNVNLEAPVGALLFLGGCLVLLGCAALIVYTLVTRKFALARIALFVVLAGLGLYLALMLTFSFASTEKVLARGEEKHFCELDCHLAYSIIGVRRTKTIAQAAPVAEVSAKGDFYIVTVRTRFDETTISSRRGNFPLTPNQRILSVTDEQGNRYGISAEGQRALERSGGGGTPLMTPLRPGESYTTELVFDLPQDARNPIFLMNEELLPTYFIIGHENSLLHKQTKFRLGA